MAIGGLLAGCGAPAGGGGGGGGGDTWARQIASATYDEVRALAVGPGGTVVAAGITGGAPFGGVHVGGADVFVAAYDADGDLLWSRQFGTADDDEPTAVVVRPDGDVVVVGSTLMALFAPAPGGQDAFAVRLAAATGATVWARQLGTVSTDEGLAVALAADGDVYVGGRTTDAFPGFTLSGVGDAFVARLDGDDGTLVDVEQFGGAGVDRVQGLAVVPGGDLVAVGSTTFVMPGSGLATPVGNVDAYLRRFTPGLVATQTVQFGLASEAVTLQAVVLAPDGDLRVAGEASGALGATPHEGSRDVFVARVDPATLLRDWTVQAGSDGTDVANDLAVDADGVAVLVGATSSDFVEPFGGSERAILLFVDAAGGGVERAQFGEGDNTYGNGVGIAGAGVLAIGGWTNGPFAGLPAQGDDGFVLTRGY